MTDSTGARWWRVLAALALLPALASPSSAAEGHAQDELVVVTGRVSDASGRPVPGLKVVFEAARGKVSLRKLRTVEGHPTSLATSTDVDGEYRFEWKWHDFYNRFSLALLLRDPAVQGDGWRQLQRLDISSRMADASPVIANLDAGDDETVERHRAFFSGLSSDPERQAFSEMGVPDRSDRLDTGGRAEVTWWYFRAGRAYRFVDGDLIEISRFDPVEPF